MVTDIRDALRDAADTGPTGRVDLDLVVAAGTRRVRRRRLAAVGATGLAVALAVVGTTLTAGLDRADGPPPPADLRLDEARPVALEVLAATRTFWEDPNEDLDHDRLDGITEDGLVLRSRYTYEGDVFELGLLDVGTGRSDWLPRPPWDVGELAPVQLGADRLVFLDRRHHPVLTVLTFDRDARTWSRQRVEPPAAATGRFFGFYFQVDPDGRIHLLDSDTWSWWSMPPTGGPLRREPAFDGRIVAWSGPLRASAGLEGDVTLTRDGRDLTVADGPPEGCDAPTGVDAERPLPPQLEFAGNRLVVTFLCRSGERIVVHGVDGRAELTLAPDGVRVVSTDAAHLLLTDHRHIYVLELESRQLLLLEEGGAAGHRDGQLGQGLVLWTRAGPSDDRDSYDVRYRVARLP